LAKTPLERSDLERTFGSVDEALDFLESEWPLKRGERYDCLFLQARAQPHDAGGGGVMHLLSRALRPTYSAARLSRRAKVAVTL